MVSIPYRNYDDYFEQVFNYLEYLGYPELIEFYEPEGPAKSISVTIDKFWDTNAGSHRMCAIVIWSMTMHKIARESKTEKVN